MSKRQAFMRPSLTQLFSAPEGHEGRFGWVCGYSASASFMNLALDRFTGKTEGQRAAEGVISIALILDHHHRPISNVEVPGLATLGFKSTALPFRLMHAKVALLGFRSLEDKDKWCVRLIVSTGNWTQQTLEDSLDLAWYIDLCYDDLKSDSLELRQNRADMYAASKFFYWLEEYCESSLVNSELGETRLTKDKYDWLVDTLDLIKKPRGVIPRFIDSTRKSLVNQLPDALRAQGVTSSNNTLIMGSGFYDSGKSNKSNVAMKIIESLREQGLLTVSPNVDLYVNPDNCQSIAQDAEEIEMRGWRIKQAVTPSWMGGGRPRTLHAKFMLGANTRSNSENLNRSWIYMGSGNFTQPGFMCRAGSKGNVEAGVVFAPEQLVKHKVKGCTEENVVGNLLPIDFKDNPVDVIDLQEGDGFLEPDEIYPCPPTPYLLWREKDECGGVLIDPIGRTPYDIRTAGGEWCSFTEYGYDWEGPQPRQVMLRWEDEDVEYEGLTPVVDSFGRIAATPLPELNLNEAWVQLLRFPRPLEGEELNGEILGEVDGLVNSQAATRPIAEYPIRQVMMLVDGIADKQCAIDERDWSVWCTRLEQTLIQMTGDPCIEYFRKELELNPISPLREAAFRPTFAESDDSKDGVLYLSVLSKVEQRWHVAELESLSIEGGMS